nr:conserved uncharacterized protein [uncultured bacterium]
MISVRIEGDLRRVMAVHLTAVGEAVTAAVTETAEGVKAGMRNQVMAAGLGQKLANSWRSKVYPNHGINAAAVVYSKAPVIMGAFATGVTIRGKNGLWLAIPTRAAPKTVLGRRTTPANLERAWGIRLHFIYRRGRASLLVATVRSGGRTISTPMFILVPQVTLKKRLDVDGARAWAAVHLKAALARRLNT